MPNPPDWAKLKPGVSLTLDKSWGQRQPKPSVAVIEDLDYPNCIGAYWGEINTTVHKGFGVSGALTNGVVRDLGDLPSGFPVIAGSVGPSHGYVYVRSVGLPVRLMGLEVRQGDLVHADRHGAVVVPSDVVAALGQAIGKLQATERISWTPPERLASTSRPSNRLGPTSKPRGPERAPPLDLRVGVLGVAVDHHDLPRYS